MVSFYHYDFYAQALAKIERGHSQDRADVRSMLDGGLVVRERLMEFFETMVPMLYRYPAVAPKHAPTAGGPTRFLGAGS